MKLNIFVKRIWHSFLCNRSKSYLKTFTLCSDSIIIKNCLNMQWGLLSRTTLQKFPVSCLDNLFGSCIVEECIGILVLKNTYLNQYTNRAVLLSNKREWTTDTCNRESTLRALFWLREPAQNDIYYTFLFFDILNVCIMKKATLVVSWWWGMTLKGLRLSRWWKCFIAK